jgi:hypothetical protein
VASTNAHALRGPVSVSGVEYSDASTQALELNDDAHGEDIQFSATANYPVISKTTHGSSLPGNCRFSAARHIGSAA